MNTPKVTETVPGPAPTLADVALETPKPQVSHKDSALESPSHKEPHGWLDLGNGGYMRKTHRGNV